MTQNTLFRRTEKLTWRETDPTPHGNRQWTTADGMFRLICSEQYDGLKLPREYRLFAYLRGGWVRIAETRSRKKCEKIARQRAAAYEED